MIGSDRYLTVNVHHSAAILGDSKVAPLGLVRVDDRATGQFLKELVTARFEDFGLTEKDFAAAVTDGAKNVLRAVRLMELRQQKCFVHGLDLVVRRVIYGKDAEAFDVAMFFALYSEESSSAPQNMDDEENPESIDGNESESEDEEESEVDFAERPGCSREGP